MAADGEVDAADDGDVTIEAQYGSCHARSHVRLVHGQPGRVLAVLHGFVYGERDGRLHPIARAHVQVVSGPSAGLSTTTTDNGSYELAGVVPGEIAIRASKIGHTSGETSTQLHAGDNRLSVLIEELDATKSEREAQPTIL